MNDDTYSTIKGIYDKLKNNTRLSTSEIINVIDQAHEILKTGTSFVKIKAKVNIIGDIHGQFTDLLKLLGDKFDPEKYKYLFLGDYVDRGPNSIEVITFLLCCKILYKDNIILLRGNHETREISSIYGFKDEITEKYGNKPDNIYEKFVKEIFAYLPLAAEVSERIFCVHGGLSQYLQVKNENGVSNDLDVIFNSIKFPITDANDNELIQDLLWADPSPDTKGFTPSERGTSFTFGKDTVAEFLVRHSYDLVCRAHQVVDNGFDFPFFPDYTVVTIFSAPNYCNEFNNKAVMLIVDDNLECTFKFVDPNDPNYKKNNK